jgi:hypothetical protein
MHESIDESPNFMIICFFGAKMSNFGEISMRSASSIHVFHVFWKLLPQSLQFDG